MLPLLFEVARADAPKTGQFEIAFVERSPLSAKKELPNRLGKKDPGKDYDLSAEPFRLVVGALLKPPGSVRTCYPPRRSD